MHRLSGYPQWLYGGILLVLALLLGSGTLLIPHLLELRLDMDSPVHVSGGIRLGSAAMHSLSAFLTVGVVGALATVHMRAGWKRKLNRLSGILLFAIFAFLLLSALGIFYFGDMDLSRLSSLSHTLVGVALVPLFIWHSVAGRRIRNQHQRR